MGIRDNAQIHTWGGGGTPKTLWKMEWKDKWKDKFILVQRNFRNACVFFFLILLFHELFEDALFIQVHVCLGTLDYVYTHT